MRKLFILGYRKNDKFWVELGGDGLETVKREFDTEPEARAAIERMLIEARANPNVEHLTIVENKSPL